MTKVLCGNIINGPLVDFDHVTGQAVFLLDVKTYRGEIANVKVVVIGVNDENI